MDCKEVKEMLNALADGEVTDGEREEILSHIAECESCRAEYEELKAIKKEFSRLRIRLNGELADSVMEKITAEAHPKKNKPFLFRHIGTVAALIIVAGMFFLTRNTAEDNKAAESESAEVNTDSVILKGDYNFSISPNGSNTLTDDSDRVEESVMDEAPMESMMPEAPMKEWTEEPKASEPKPGTQLKSEAVDLPQTEESVQESENLAVNDFRISNSISLDTAVIFVDSDMETLTPLFDSIESLGMNCINLNQPHGEVMDILFSNSISVTMTDIPENTTDTTIVVE